MEKNVNYKNDIEFYLYNVIYHGNTNKKISKNFVENSRIYHLLDDIIVPKMN